MQGGVDQGTCLLYSKLSYRRKFIRGLWTAAIWISVLVAIQMLGLVPAESVFVGWCWIGVCLIFWVAQEWDTYSRWQAEKRQAANGRRMG